MAAKPRSGIAWYRRFYFCRDKSRQNLCSVETFLDKIKKNVGTLLEVIPVLREESRQFFFGWRERSRHYIFFVEDDLDRNILKSDQKQIQILSFSGPTRFTWMALWRFFFKISTESEMCRLKSFVEE